MTYKSSGVDIARGNAAKERIRKIVHGTFGPNVLSDIGHFGGLYRFPKNRFRDPVLVSSTDGVGTKLKIAVMLNRHDTVGEDLVNHCVNDVLCCGAAPLFFLDYLGLGAVEEAVIAEVVRGLARGCRKNGCALIGGETAQMPGFYADGEYDLAGTIVGAVEKKNIIDGKRIRPGDALIGLPSSGLHTNGYSLARRALLGKYRLDQHLPELGDTLGAELLKGHKSYLRPVMAVLKKIPVKGIAHITGGGIVENTKRIIPPGLKMILNWSSWEMPPIFDLIQQEGRVPYDDMIRTFNLGVGLILIVAARDADRCCRALKSAKEKPFVIGTIVRK